MFYQADTGYPRRMQRQRQFKPSDSFEPKSSIRFSKVILIFNSSSSKDGAAELWMRPVDRVTTATGYPNTNQYNMQNKSLNEGKNADPTHNARVKSIQKRGPSHADLSDWRISQGVIRLHPSATDFPNLPGTELSQVKWYCYSAMTQNQGVNLHSPC